MLLAVFLFYRRRQKIIFCIIIDHGLCQDLIFTWIAGRIFQLTVHECSDLIHIKINARNIFQADMLDPVQTCKNTV